MEIEVLLTISASLLAFIFVILLLIFALKTPSRPRGNPERVSSELNKIKDQINGHDDEEW
ncbi:hypothetical protein COU60_03090 [Candidatus Pacearchaeota archaeon CG10_big_fil_rev_8_21_14_0_10_34_76]|nr:MAG: hypothetical protein COU60_03090 [Candidatus Pacearchaeota archaeon CG10_big_fil_rev_8_21_14_0_10_34_76]